MKRLAQIDNGVVTGILLADRVPPDVRPGRAFIDVTDQPDVREKFTYDGDRFSPPAVASASESPIETILKKVTAIAAKLEAQ